MDIEVKEAKYPSNKGSKNCTILYVLDGSKVYFRGVIPTNLSTINAAESIALAIAKAESRDWDLLSWYDVQTSHNYAHLPEGMYKVQRVEFEKSEDGRPCMPSWVDVAASKNYPRKNDGQDLEWLQKGYDQIGEVDVNLPALNSEHCEKLIHYIPVL